MDPMDPTRETMTRFGEWLTARALNRGFTTNSELAERAGISGPQIGRWMKGRMLPQPENMRRLAEALGVPVLELYVRAGYITEAEVGAGLPEREPMDPRVLPLIRVLEKIDRLPPRDRGVIEGMLAAMNSFVAGLDQMQATFTQRLLGTNGKDAIG